MKQKIINDVNHMIYRCLSEDEILKRDDKLQEMMFYALGFEPDGTLLNCGKRLRPLFCCLVCGVLSEYYEPALTYAAGIEMLHNFTLIHDDIEDKGDVRHNRPALWKRDGLSLALNAGDMLYNLALSVIAKADESSGRSGLRHVLGMASRLFLGQHRDISFEARTDISESEYLHMVRGKTSALFGTSFALGAAAVGAPEPTVREFEYAGRRLGIAFQIRDDYLGTWGNSDEFGKSVSSDITDKKNTLAVVYTAERDPEFREKWNAYSGDPERVPEFVAMMEKAGAPEYLRDKCVKYTREAEDTLALHRADNKYQALLDEVIESLLERNK